MSILSRLFASKHEKPMSLDRELYKIDKVHSFNLEFKPSYYDAKLEFDGDCLMECDVKCYVVVNGITFYLNTAFDVRTEFGDGSALGKVLLIEKFDIMRPALNGIPIRIKLSNNAKMSIATHVKDNLSDTSFTTLRSDDTYYCV